MLTTILTEIVDRYHLRRGNARWSGPCPKCGGSPTSDKFVIKDDGGFKCYGCDFKGDIITWLRDIDGKTCPEAHEAAGITCRADSCQVRGTCRMGDGSGRRQAPTGHSVAPPRPDREQTLPTVASKQPADLWLAWAESLVAAAAATLAKCHDVIAWLEARGIDAAAVDRFRLGWLGHDRKVQRSSIAIPPKDGKTTLWVPGGLVIPTFSPDGRLHRIRIRRTDDSRARFLEDLKYVWIEGSGTQPMMISAAGQCRGVVIVEAELDAMAVSAAHQQVTVIAVGTVSGGLTAAQRDELHRAQSILVALDADSGKDGQAGAGPKNIARWLREYRQAQFWPVPDGKDPGDYAKAGGNLRAWIEAGLVPEVPPASHDVAFSSGCSPMGEKGGCNLVVEDFAAAEETPAAKHYVLPIDGREIHVTDDRATWEWLVGEGKIAFSENELVRLREASAEMSETDRLAFVMQAIQVKEVFGAAYIKRGEVVA